MKLSDIKAKVLIVDDDTDIRSAVRLTLESELAVNYLFTEADTAASGMEALKLTRPDVIILDLHMPGENGFDFIHKLERDKSLPLTKVLILTADNSIKNLWEAANAGIDAYHFIGKPFINDELRATVLGLVLPKRAA